MPTSPSPRPARDSSRGAARSWGRRVAGPDDWAPGSVARDGPSGRARLPDGGQPRVTALPRVGGLVIPPPPATPPPDDPPHLQRVPRAHPTQPPMPVAKFAGRRRPRVDPWNPPDLEWDSAHVSRWVLSFYLLTCLFQTIGLFTVNAPVFAEAAAPSERGSAVSATLSWVVDATDDHSVTLQALVRGETEGEEATAGTGKSRIRLALSRGHGARSSSALAHYLSYLGDRGAEWSEGGRRARSEGGYVAPVCASVPGRATQTPGGSLYSSRERILGDITSWRRPSRVPPLVCGVLGSADDLPDPVAPWVPHRSPPSSVCAQFLCSKLRPLGSTGLARDRTAPGA